MTRCLSWSFEYVVYQFSVVLLFVSQDAATLPIIKPVPAPQSVGEEAATMKSPSQSILSNFSFTNLKTEIKNIRLLLNLISSAYRLSCLRRESHVASLKLYS